ncbi:MAG: amidohydrolase family protein [Gemmatimonadota bacterium]|nr:amidohydrolase family protein [Gemmatimonadota bacterium]
MRIDAHMHVAGHLASVGWRGNWTDDRVVIEAADRLEIDQLCCSIPIQGLKNPRPDGMREVNDSLLHAMRRFPGRILGYAFLDPRFQREARDEIDRCLLKLGMMGVKLYNQCRCWDPAVLPIVERCIDLGVPILHHGGKQTPVSGRPWQTYRSDSADFARLARLYPDVIIIEGHPIVGDWEWAIKTLRDVSNVYVDTSGSLNDDGFIEMAVRELGAARVLFATDVAMEAGVGKVLGAAITARQREGIFGENMKRIMQQRV